MIKANLKFKTRDPKKILKALKPDLEPISDRSSILLDSKENFLEAKIKSKDLNAFRACLNSFLRTLNPVKEVSNRA